MKKRLLLVEDDRSLGETLKERLEKEGYSIQWTVSCQSAKKVAENGKIDLAIIDVRLPDGSGFDLAEEMQSLKETPPFLFLTAQAGAPERLRGFELGAEEFIPKPFHLKELLLRVRHVLEAHKHTNQAEIAWYSGYRIDFEKYIILTPEKEEKQLSKRDCELLHLLIEDRHRTISRSEILDRLWGEENFPTNRTVDNSIVRLRQTFGEKGNEAIRSIRGVGYRWIGEIKIGE